MSTSCTASSVALVFGIAQVPPAHAHHVFEQAAAGFELRRSGVFDRHVHRTKPVRVLGDSIYLGRFLRMLKAALRTHTDHDEPDATREDVFD